MYIANINYDHGKLNAVVFGDYYEGVVYCANHDNKAVLHPEHGLVIGEYDFVNDMADVLCHIYMGTMTNLRYESPDDEKETIITGTPEETELFLKELGMEWKFDIVPFEDWLAKNKNRIPKDVLQELLKHMRRPNRSIYEDALQMQAIVAKIEFAIF